MDNDFKRTGIYATQHITQQKSHIMLSTPRWWKVLCQRIT